MALAFRKNEQISLLNVPLDGVELWIGNGLVVGRGEAWRACLRGWGEAKESEREREPIGARRSRHRQNESRGGEGITERRVVHVRVNSLYRP